MSSLRSLALAALLVAPASALADYLLAKDVAGNEVRLYNEPCTDQKIIDTVPASARESLQRGQTTIEGVTESMCYGLNPMTMRVIVVFDDGKGFTVPAKDFQLVEGI